jgi:hypothetical protein
MAERVKAPPPPPPKNEDEDESEVTLAEALENAAAWLEIAQGLAAED